MLIRHPAGRMRRTGPRDIPADPDNVLRAASRPARSVVASDALTHRARVGTPGHLARGQQFLGQNYFPGLVSKPVPENKNVTFCCDACERGSWRRLWSLVTRVHLVVATEEAWSWVEGATTWTATRMRAMTKARMMLLTLALSLVARIRWARANATWRTTWQGTRQG